MAMTISAQPIGVAKMMEPAVLITFMSFPESNTASWDDGQMVHIRKCGPAHRLRAGACDKGEGCAVAARTRTAMA